MRLLRFAWLLLPGLLAASRVSASDTTVNPVDRLNQIETQIRKDSTQIETLSQSAARFVRDQSTLRARLIEAAARAQARERDLDAVEQRLAQLETAERGAMESLTAQRARLAGLLAVLQRMGREPPPALVIRPNDATSAARSAMLLSAVVPGAQEKARRLGDSLAALQRVRAQATDERLRVAAASAALQKDRTALIQLLEQRRLMAAEAAQDLQTTRARVEQLGEQARDLRALIASLVDDGQTSGARGGGATVTNQIASFGLTHTLPLEQLRGRLKWPANGRVAARFGTPDASGGHHQGIYLETLPGAAVISPCDGKIMFAGPFRGYGQMLIISAKGGYHVLLAGLTNIDGVVGQVVLTGEPLGRMGRPASAAAAGGLSGPGGQKLYIEFRRNDAPIDPLPWFQALKERVSG